MSYSNFLVSPGASAQDWYANLSNYGGSYLNPITSSPDVPQIAVPQINLGNSINSNAGPMSTQLPTFDSADPGLAMAGQGIASQAGPSLWERFKSLPWLDSKNAQGIGQQGILSPAISGLTSISNGYLAMKQLGLAQDQFNFQKDAFNKNWAAKKATTNSALEDRQRARVASNSGAYQSVGDYMNQYGIK